MNEKRHPKGGRPVGELKIGLASITRILCVSFCVGIVAASPFLDLTVPQTSMIFGFSIITLLIFTLALFRQKALLVMVIAACLGASYIWLRNELWLQKRAVVQGDYQGIGSIAFIERAPDKQRLLVSIKTPRGRGNVFVYAPRYPLQRVGQQIQFHCELKPLEAFDDFAFDRYGEQRGIVAYCKPSSILPSERGLVAARIIFLRSRIGTKRRLPLRFMSQLHHFWAPSSSIIRASFRTRYVTISPRRASFISYPSQVYISPC